MAEDFNKMTPEQLKRLSDILSEATALSDKRAEIIQKILDGEIKIGDLRISYLKQYFDEYSENLNAIARKYSELDEIFLILNQKIASAAEASVAAAEAAAASAKKAADALSSVNPGNNPKTTRKKTNQSSGDESQDSTDPTKPQKHNNSTPNTSNDNINSAAEGSVKHKKPSEASDDHAVDETIEEDQDTSVKTPHNKAPEVDSFNNVPADSLAAGANRTVVTENSDIDSEADTDSEANSTANSIKPKAEDASDAEDSSVSITTEDSASDANNTDTIENAEVHTDNTNQDNVDDQVDGTPESFSLTTAESLSDEKRLAGKVLETRKAALQDFERLSKLLALNEEEREEELAELKQKNAKAELENLEERIKQYQNFAERQSNIDKTLFELSKKRNLDEQALEDLATDKHLTRMQEVLSAEMAVQDMINNLEAELALAASEPIAIGEKGGDITAAGSVRSDEVNTDSQKKNVQDFEAEMARFRAAEELKARRKNNGVLTKEDSSRIEKEIAKRFSLDKLNDEKRLKERWKLEEKQLLKQERAETSRKAHKMFEKDLSITERAQAIKEATTTGGKPDSEKILLTTITLLSDLAKQLEKQIDDIAKLQSPVDTRMQGSSSKQSMGSYWSAFQKDMMSVGAVNPFFKQDEFAKNIQEVVKTGIAFNVTQRAFLLTIRDKIATTFDVFDSTLLRLIRLQQADSTAGRMGMESALNAFLNSMYETSEYLNSIAANVRSSLAEMQALMSAEESVEVEYQVQKWLGSLYSVGMSDTSVQNISNALGQIASGQVEALIQGGAANLLIMAANEAGISIAEVLNEGLSADKTNELLKAAVGYLADLADSSKDSKVVQQQLATVFGVKASDLKAATNLVVPGSVESIFSNSMTYDNMLARLNVMASTMGSRTSIAEMMTNIWENGKYTLASSMASNPVSYFIYKMAKVLDDAAGGIDLPFLNVMGFGVDLNTTVSDLMRVAAVGTGILGSIGPMISGLGNSFSGSAMLNALGIGKGSGLSIVPRGAGEGIGSSGDTGGKSTSGSGTGSYAGNTSGSDVKDSTVQESEDSKKQQMIEAKEEEEANKVDTLNETVLKIYELLDDVTNGSGHVRVKIEGYGLVKGGSALAASTLGGVSGSAAATDTGSDISGEESSSGSSSGGSANGGGSAIINTVSLGGWTTI